MGWLKPEGSKLAIMPLEADEEVATVVEMIDEFPQDRGLKEQA